ncbi:hypothetical protein ACJX0J_033537, partial [Zea mays]
GLWMRKGVKRRLKTQDMYPCNKKNKMHKYLEVLVHDYKYGIYMDAHGRNKSMTHAHIDMFLYKNNNGQ